MALTRSCPACGGAAPAHAEFCPGCLSSLPALPVPTADSPLPDVAARPALAACALHRDKLAVGTCPSCGTFFCLECVPDAAERDEAECPTCRASQQGRDGPEQVRRLFRDLAAGMAIFIGIEFFFGALLPALAVVDPEPAIRAVGMLIGGFVVCLPLLIAAAVTWLAQSRIAGWLGLSMELAILVFDLVATGAMTLVWPVLLVIPVVGVFQLWHASQLRKRLAAERHSAQASLAGPAT